MFAMGGNPDEWVASIASFIRNNFGNAMTPRDYALHVVAILTDSKYDGGVVYGLKSEAGIIQLDG